MPPKKIQNTQKSFKDQIISNLKNKDLNETSINYYLRNLSILNKGKPLEDFHFLENKEEIQKILDSKKPSTKRNYLASIVSVVSSDPKNKKIKDLYYDEMIKLNKELKSEQETGIKSEAQKKNWIGEESLEEIKTRYQKAFDKLKNEKELTETQFDMLTRYVVLSLYTLIPPRRNKDYQNMYLIKGTKAVDDKHNYLDMTNKEFIFNDFKTKKSEGQQTFDIPENLMAILEVYAKFHPLIDKGEKKYDVPFLVNYEGVPIGTTNEMTRLLNKIFQKKVGSTMLRHVYLSNKYGNIKEEMAKDAKAMAHNVSMQSDYIKK